MQTLERKDVAFDLDTKSLTDQGEFEGYAATFGNVDQGGDICVSGCFAESLQKRPAGKVKMLLHHDTRRPCGAWSVLSEDSRGLNVKGRLLLSTTDGRETYEFMRADVFDAMSIGYRALADEIDRANGVRKILKADLMEVSIVTFPMNERASISSIKSAAEFTTQDWRDLEAALRDEGLSRADSVKAVSGLKNWFRRDAEAPETAPRDEAASVELLALAARIKALTA